MVQEIRSYLQPRDLRSLAKTCGRMWKIAKEENVNASDQFVNPLLSHVNIYLREVNVRYRIFEIKKSFRIFYVSYSNGRRQLSHSIAKRKVSMRRSWNDSIPYQALYRRDMDWYRLREFQSGRDDGKHNIQESISYRRQRLLHKRLSPLISPRFSPERRVVISFPQSPISSVDGLWEIIINNILCVVIGNKYEIMMRVCKDSMSKHRNEWKERRLIVQGCVEIHPVEITAVSKNLKVWENALLFEHLFYLFCMTMIIEILSCSHFSWQLAHWPKFRQNGSRLLISSQISNGFVRISLSISSTLSSFREARLHTKAGEASF